MGTFIIDAKTEFHMLSGLPKVTQLICKQQELKATTS